MKSSKRTGIHVLEFRCEHPLKFYEHCSACARFGDGCTDLAMGEEILRGKKHLVYNENEDPADGIVFAGAFKCTAPLKYFEATRRACGHEGKCREEGLLLALLSGNKGLDYSEKVVHSLARKRRAGEEEVVGRPSAQALS
jgi:hypothetical protein